jgi:hypothetical protein
LVILPGITSPSTTRSYKRRQASRRPHLAIPIPSHVSSPARAHSHQALSATVYPSPSRAHLRPPRALPMPKMESPTSYSLPWSLVGGPQASEWMPAVSPLVAAAPLASFLNCQINCGWPRLDPLPKGYGTSPWPHGPFSTQIRGCDPLGFLHR